MRKVKISVALKKVTSNYARFKKTTSSNPELRGVDSTALHKK